MTNKPVIQSIIDGVYQDLLINPNGGNVSINTEYSEGYQLNVNGIVKIKDLTINGGTHNNVLATNPVDGSFTLNGQPLGARIYKIDELLSGTFSSEDISNSVNAYVGKNLLQRVTAIETTGSQPAFNGTGFVKVNGSTISYDNNSYYVNGSNVISATDATNAQNGRLLFDEYNGGFRGSSTLSVAYAVNAGSSINSDKLGGQLASYYLPYRTFGSAANSNTDQFINMNWNRFTGDANTLGLLNTTGVYNISSASNVPSYYGTLLGFWNGDISTQLYLGYNGDMSWRKSIGTSYTGSIWRTVWDSVNFNPANYLPLTGGFLSGFLDSNEKISTNNLFLTRNSAIGNQILINASGANYGAIQTISSNSWGLGTGTGNVDKNINNTALIWDINKNVTIGGNIKIGISLSDSPTSSPSCFDSGRNYSNGKTKDKLKFKLYDEYGFTVGSDGDVQYHSNVQHQTYIDNNLKSTITSTGLYINGEIKTNDNSVIHSGNIGSQTVSNLMNSGGGGIQSSVLGQGYNYAVCVREPLGQGGNTAVEAAPRLGFHWGGLVASSISIGTNGSFYLNNNPGGSRENLYLNNLYGSSINMSGDIFGDIFHGNGSGLNNVNASYINGIDSGRIVSGDNARGRSTYFTGQNANTSDSNNASGFYCGSSVTGMPSGDWWNWMTCAGGSWGGSDGYAFQLANSFWGDDLRVRRMTSGTWHDWQSIIHSGNIANQNVANSDTVDGVHIWRGSLASYNALTKDANTMYIII